MFGRSDAKVANRWCKMYIFTKATFWGVHQVVLIFFTCLLIVKEFSFFLLVNRTGSKMINIAILGICFYQAGQF